MKERPILFSGPMVQAILKGRKTQTRRVVKLPLKDPLTGCEVAGCEAQSLLRQGEEICPYGQPGDRLWVRETWTDVPDGTFLYRCDPMYDTCGAGDFSWKWKPSIHMPRQASRITLEITDVRVERLQDISDSDAIAEGIPDYPNFTGDSPVHDYSALWESINGTGSWDANPWVWVIGFRRIEP